MKKDTRKDLLKLFVAILLTFTVASCSKTVRFQTSTVVPGADAKVIISKDDNKNNVIEMTVTNLADPTRLSPPKKTYVVWMQTANSGIKNIGQLISETSYFSSARKAVLKSTTPFSPQKFFVTAEDNANIQYPGTQVVLTTKDF
ncbi:hypothetical protein [Pedobacter sp.]|uniref:hypothetical protein n=1 Tax=Pedobacter sp. TaxID=1411316 RepID=UPI003D7FD5FD